VGKDVDISIVFSSSVLVVQVVDLVPTNVKGRINRSLNPPFCGGGGFMYQFIRKKKRFSVHFLLTVPFAFLFEGFIA